MGFIVETAFEYEYEKNGYYCGERYPFYVEVTKPNEETDFQAYTFRGVSIGDTREEVLALYPEIDPEEQRQLSGTEDLLFIEDGGIQACLSFYFEGDRVVKITTDTTIN